MIGNYPKALAAVLVHEGGYVNNPKDPGGMTNLGCTKTVWETFGKGWERRVKEVNASGLKMS